MGLKSKLRKFVGIGALALASYACDGESRNNKINQNYNTNRVPIIVSKPNLEAKVNKEYKYDVDAFDYDKDKLIYSLIQGPEGMVIDSLTGLISWTPSKLQEGQHNIIVNVNDSKENVKQNYTVNVNPNLAPEISSFPVTTAEVTIIYRYDVNATDPDDTILNYYLKLNPNGMVINNSTGEITWTPSEQQRGQNNVEVCVSDDINEICQNYVVNINRLPVINSTPIIKSNVNTLYEYDVDAIDLDNDTLTYYLIQNPINMSIDSVTGLVSWTPLCNEYGLYDMIVEVSDGKEQIRQQFTLEILTDNLLPAITSIPPSEVNANNPWLSVFSTKYIYNISASDPEGGALIYSILNGPQGATLTGSVLEWVPPYSSLGLNNFVISVDDGNCSVEQSFDVNVKYPYIDESGNPIAEYDYVKGNDEMILICEKPCSFGFTYPVDLGGNIVENDKDYFNKKFIGLNFGFNELKNFIGVTPDWSLKPIEVHILSNYKADKRCERPDLVAYFTSITRNEGYSPLQGLICIHNSGESGLDPTSLLDQITYVEEMAHANQSGRIPSLISSNFHESQARAITNVMLPENWDPILTSYCDSRLGVYYQNARVINNLCNQCGYDKDKEPLFWNRVAINPASSIYELAQVYTEITPCIQTDVENIFIDNLIYHCSDGIDNNSNGLIDLDDPNCTGLTDESEFN